MHQIDIINTYLHLLHRSDRVFLYRMFDSYEHLTTMQAWVQENDIDLPFIHRIDSDMFAISQKARSFLKLQAMMHYPCVQEVERWVESQNELYHVVFLPSVMEEHLLNKCFTSKQWIDQYQRDNVHNLYINDLEEWKMLSFNAPSSSFFEALYKIDNWPGLLVTKKEKTIFIPVSNQEDIDDVFSLIEQEKIFDKEKPVEDAMYIMHLSDLHLGPKSKKKGLSVLCDSIDSFSKRVNSSVPLQFIITGDLMNSPNKKAIASVTYFLRWLKRKHHGCVTYVLGNHDVLFHGLNIMSSPKTRIIASLLEDELVVNEQQKVIYIKINSVLGGNLARGKIGKKQLMDIEEELDMVDNLEEYTLIALVHHHVLPIEKDDFLKRKWHEKIFIHRIIESSKVLKDSEYFIDWLKSKGICYVFHGHKHLPYFNHSDDLYVVAGGSSCGGGVNERKSRYLSYNVVKFDPISKQMKYCFICYDDITKLERQRVKVHLF